LTGIAVTPHTIPASKFIKRKRRQKQSNILKPNHWRSRGINRCRVADVP
jgi:hypothetical protein